MLIEVRTEGHNQALKDCPLTPTGCPIRAQMVLLKITQSLHVPLGILKFPFFFVSSQSPVVDTTPNEGFVKNDFKFRIQVIFFSFLSRIGQPQP